MFLYALLGTSLVDLINISLLYLYLAEELWPILESRFSHV